jgi:MFS family permease
MRGRREGRYNARMSRAIFRGGGGSSGWPLVAALSIAQLVSWGTIFYGFPLFVLPMEAELSWSRAELNGALSAGLLVAGLAAIPVGRRIDRHGGRLPMSLGSLAAALLFVAWSRVDSLVAFYLLWLGLGLTQALTLYAPVFAVLTRLFPADYKLRITILTLAGGLASTVFIPVIAWAIESLGWRDALLLMAACNLLLCLPVHVLLLRDRALAPAAATAVDSGAAAPADPLHRALRHPVFWGLAVCFTFYGLMHAMLTFHFVPMFGEYGVPLAVAVGILAVIGPAQVGGRILLLLVRRIDTVATGIIVMSVFLASVLLLLLYPTVVALLFVFAALYGGANGMMTILRGTAAPDLLGRAGAGAINGALTLPATMAAAIAPSLAALIWDLSGGYDAVLAAVLVAAGISAAGFAFAAIKSR